MAKNSNKSAKTSKFQWDQKTSMFIVILLVAIIGTYFLTKSYAAPKITSVGSGTCATNPASPPLTGAQPYSIIGSHIPSGYQVYQAWINGGVGLIVLGLSPPDSSGTVSNTLYANHAGTYTAQIRGINYSNGGIPKQYDLADCTYTIQ